MYVFFRNLLLAVVLEAQLSGLIGALCIQGIQKLIGSEEHLQERGVGEEAGPLLMSIDSETSH